tara:strand:- start:1976 stop:2545 length:570 start_codon:yes stop_codon:yes gene_type:complete
MGIREMKQRVDEEITSIYNQLRINAEKVCTYNSHLWADDLLAHTLQSFLEKPIEKQYQIVISDSVKVSALERYLTRAMSMAIRSSSSPFYHTYRKKNEKFRELWVDIDYVKEYNIDDPNVEDELVGYEKLVKNYLEELHFYSRFLIQEHYYRKKTLREMSEQIDIPTSTLSRDIKKALVELKQKVEKHF